MPMIMHDSRQIQTSQLPFLGSSIEGPYAAHDLSRTEKSRDALHTAIAKDRRHPGLLSVRPKAKAHPPANRESRGRSFRNRQSKIELDLAEHTSRDVPRTAAAPRIVPVDRILH